MKRVLLALAIASASLATLSSCTKEYITNFVPSFTKIEDVTKSEWKGSGNRKYVNINVKEIDNYYLDQGIIHVAMSEDGEQTYYNLPATINGVSFNAKSSLGMITIIAEDPIMDDNIEISINTDYVFKISLTEADFVK